MRVYVTWVTADKNECNTFLRFSTQKSVLTTAHPDVPRSDWTSVLKVKGETVDTRQTVEARDTPFTVNHSFHSVWSH